MSDQPKIYIAGIGMITAIGAHTAMTAAAVRAGVSGYKACDYLNQKGQPITMARVPAEVFTSPEFEIDEGSYPSRLIIMAIIALREALASQSIQQPIPLILALPEKGVGTIEPETLISNLLKQKDLPLRADRVQCIAGGRAAGIQGLGWAIQHLEQGADFVLLGGSDSYGNALRIQELDKAGRLLAPGSKDGFVPGEAAGFLLLTRHPQKALTQGGYIRDRETSIKAYKKHGARDKEGDNSYEGYYTNIVRMERHVDIAVPEGVKEYKFKTYIEGVATEDKGVDELTGFALGTSLLWWRAGILDKVKKGILDVVKKITMEVTDKENIIIDEIIVDLFGFSRGAAVARKFIHEALREDSSLKTRLQDKGYTVVAVKICFVGLYDTVSTYASDVKGAKKIIKGEANNVEELQLHAISHAEETIQLAAADEHRFHFSLTNIQSAGGKGKQFFLPGVHSDIGGGYRDAGSENQPLLGNTGLLAAFVLQGGKATAPEIEADRNQLIAAGWYQQDKINIENHDYYLNSEGSGQQLIESRGLTGERSGIHNSYSQIPLHIMARYARAKGIVFKDQFDEDEEIPEALSDVKGRIDSHIASTTNSKASDWHHNAPWLKDLRHHYLHFSARMKPGHAPRYEGGKRAREIHDG